MKTKQKVISDKLAELPENVTLVDGCIDYLSCQHQKIPKGITAQQAYITMTSSQPKWLSILFSVRDAFSRLAGVEEVKGFNELEGKDFTINDKMHFFNVVEKSDDKLTLIIRDSHLDVCLCLVVVSNADKNSNNDLYLTTSVKNNNFFGRLYMVPVSIIHPFIAKKLLLNINAQ